MKKWIFVFSLVLAFNAYGVNDWTDCGTDAHGNTANCQYKIDTDGTLTIRGIGENGNIGNWLESSPPWMAQKNNIHNVVIENSIKDLGQRAFKGIRTIDPVQVPSSITQISDYAFNESSIKEVILPNSVVSIGWDAFSWSSLSKIDIPDSVTTIDSWAFRGTNLENIVFPDTLTSIGAATLTYLKHLKTLTIGENTELKNAFYLSSDTSIGVDFENLQIYCTGNTAKCDANLETAGYPNLKSQKATTKQINGVTYVYDASGKLVTTSGSRKEKRIYTIDEANQVTGTKNRVSIMYR